MRLWYIRTAWLWLCSCMFYIRGILSFNGDRCLVGTFNFVDACDFIRLCRLGNFTAAAGPSAKQSPYRQKNDYTCHYDAKLTVTATCPILAVPSFHIADFSTEPCFSNRNTLTIGNCLNLACDNFRLSLTGFSTGRSFWSLFASLDSLTDSACSKFFIWLFLHQFVAMKRYYNTA